MGDVVRICRLVGGMPLALELAAAWLKVVDARTVADELEQGLDLLASRFDNMPERHQSIRAVFDQMWAMLDPAEKQVLARLSVFRGGFTREAAVTMPAPLTPWETWSAVLFASATTLPPRSTLMRWVQSGQRWTTRTRSPIPKHSHASPVF